MTVKADSKARFNLPKREFCSGDKKMVSLRLPERLMREIEKIAAAGGWSVTDVVCTALDQFAQFESSGK